MSLPTTAAASIDIEAPPSAVYDLLSDVTRMGEWSPECHRCEWLDVPNQVGSRFRGHNKSGPARWSTTAKVLAADPPSTFAFATFYRDRVSTRWTYDLEDRGGRTRLTESFASEMTPWFIALAERLFVRDRQQQLEAGIATTLAALKAAAEAEPASQSGEPGHPTRST